MKYRFAAIIGLICSFEARAQTVVDNSSNGIDAALVSAAISAVTRDMRDPISAQFKDLRLVHTSDVRPVVICGRVNAKNGLGGYAGFKPFFYEEKRNIGGTVQNMSDDLERLPLEWSGCSKALAH